MSDLNIPHAFSSGTSISSSEMNANFDAVETFVNTTGVPVLQDSAVSAAAKIADGVITSPKMATLKHGHFTLESSASLTTSGSWTVVPLDKDLEDPGTMHDPASNNTRITAPASGLYLLRATIALEANATGSRGVMARINSAGSATDGTEIDLNMYKANDIGVHRQTLTVPVRLAAGQYVEVFAYQNCGGELYFAASKTQVSLTEMR